MTEFLLVRHATFAGVGHTLAGWSPGVALDEAGAAQAACVAERLSVPSLDAVCSSPLLRARQTAERIAAPHGLAVDVRDAIGEVKYGAWTGRDINTLEEQAAWRAFNRFRSGTRVPDGETMLEVQARAVGALLDLRDAFPDGRVCITSHADVIRAILSWCLGTPLDLSLRITVDPASVTRVVLFDQDVRVDVVNDTAHLGPSQYM